MGRFSDSPVTQGFEPDNVARLAWLANVDAARLRRFLAQHRDAAAVAESDRRLADHAKQATRAAQAARKAAPRRWSGVALRIEGLIESGAARNLTHAFKLLAQGGPNSPPVDPRTVANAYYADRRRQHESANVCTHQCSAGVSGDGAPRDSEAPSFLT